MRRRLGQTTPASARASHADKPMTVAELSRKITRLLEGEIGRVRVEGEISNYRVPRSGHAYFLLKDEECAINAVCFRSTLAGLKVALADGKKIEVTGRITAYTARSEYQIIIESAREAGLGELMRRFIELRDKLKAEGLFDAARKIHLPFLPRVIGIVTSSTGAALRDILNVLGRRAGGLEIILSPCAVQGEAAPGEIVRAIKRLERDGRAEVIIAGRGGGSIEDLWAFNDERVVRAIAACPIPIVSAVGHETDTTLSDFAADLRAATPSAAAEIVTARYADVAERIAVLSRLLSRTMRAQLEARLDSLAALTNSWAMRRPIELLRAAIQRVDDLVGRLERAPDRQIERSRSLLRETFHKLSLAAPMHRIESAKSQFGQLNLRLAASRPDVRWLPRINYSRGTADQLSQRLLQSALGRMREKSLALTALAGKLESVGPDSVLQRGFSIVTRIKGNKIVTHPDQVRPGQTLRVQSAGGEWRAAALPQGDELFDLG